MFTFFCTTCEAKLIVKDEKLIGKIVACPKCGGMVLIQSADDAPTPYQAASPQASPQASPNPVRHKRFPDVLTHETPSGLIGHTSKENLRAEFFLETAPQNIAVSETEVKTRKVLVGILVGLLVVLLAALGFLMMFQRPERPSQEPPPQPLAQWLIEPPEALLDAPVVPIDVLVDIPVDTPVENPVESPVEPPVEIPAENIAIVPPPVGGLPEDVPTGLGVIGQDAVGQDAPGGGSLPLVRSPDDLLSAFEAKMPGLLESAVPSIDSDARLALPIGELNFDQVRLIEFVRVIARMTEIPMTLDIDEMRPRSLSAHTPVSGQFSEATAGEILTETLATVGLQWITVDRQLLIFPADIAGETAGEADLTFDVSDFAERTEDLTPEVLAEMVQRLIVPEASVVVLSENRLSVVQGNAVQGNAVQGENTRNTRKSQVRQRDDILRFLEQLRTIRQLPLRTELAGGALAPEAFGWDWVMMPMTLNHFRPVPLARIIAQVEEWTGLTIIIDHQSLHRALTPFASVQATVLCDQGTVNDVLELSLASVDLAALAYRIVDHHTLEITTMESARQPDKMVMEVHRFELQEDETPEDIVRSLRSAVFPDSWVVPEFSETHHGGYIVIDHPSNCLLVRQSQPAQRQIRLFLSASELLEAEPLEEEEPLEP